MRSGETAREKYMGICGKVNWCLAVCQEGGKNAEGTELDGSNSPVVDQNVTGQGLLSIFFVCILPPFAHPHGAGLQSMQ